MEENQQATARENIMGTMNINPLLVKLSVPMMVSMLVQALYNVVDSIFVSHAWVKRIRSGPTRPPRTAFFWPCAAM